MTWLHRDFKKEHFRKEGNWKLSRTVAQPHYHPIQTKIGGLSEGNDGVH